MIHVDIADECNDITQICSDVTLETSQFELLTKSQP